MFGSLAKSLFGSGTNDRAVKRYASQVAAVNALEDETAALSDEQLHASTADLRARLADGATLDDLLAVQWGMLHPVVAAMQEGE